MSFDKLKAPSVRYCQNQCRFVQDGLKSESACSKKSYAATEARDSNGRWSSGGGGSSSTTPSAATAMSHEAHHLTERAYRSSHGRPAEGGSEHEDHGKIFEDTIHATNMANSGYHGMAAHFHQSAADKLQEIGERRAHGLGQGGSYLHAAQAHREAAEAHGSVMREKEGHKN